MMTHAGSHLFDQVASKGAHHVLSTAASHAHHVAGAVTNSATPPVDMSAQASTAGHGFVRGVEQTAQVLTNHTDHITASASGLANHGMAYVVGEAAGIHATTNAIEAGASVAINAAGERVGTKI
ncbi:hypothetical protein FRB95_008984 [Tulasnella sp. JGI-2019a]|nr:hypothetical protein FRB95_008984 [Tulasnella sp. JGI-2019a]